MHKVAHAVVAVGLVACASMYSIQYEFTIVQPLLVLIPSIVFLLFHVRQLQQVKKIV